jgi:hypothetical protein
MRVWELEGGGNERALRNNAVGSDREPRSSVKIRAEVKSPVDDEYYHLEERRNWVGFDDEMVIVLKERMGDSGTSGESLMVYDFT